MKTSFPQPEPRFGKRDRAQRAHSITMEQNRAIATAKSALALRQELDTRASLKERLAQPVSAGSTGDSSDLEQPGVEMLIRDAHKVLVRYLPGVSLPDELWKVRALLEAHMFGRDGRVHRDEVVELARQIDRIAAAATSKDAPDQRGPMSAHHP